jgi:MFS family permease
MRASRRAAKRHRVESEVERGSGSSNATRRAGIMNALALPRSLGFDLPRTYWVLWAGMLINRLGAFVMPLLTLYLTKERGLTLTQAGQVLAAYGLGSLAASFVGGTLADVFGRRVTMLISLFGSAAAMLAFGAARGHFELIAASTALGALADMYRPASQAMIADVVPPEKRSQAFGLLFWAINLGFATAASVGGLVAEKSFTILFFADAATTLVFAAMVITLIAETRPPPKEHAPKSDALAPYKDRAFAPFLFISFLIVVVFMQFQTALPEAMRRAGSSTSEYGYVLALNGVLIVILQPFMGPLLMGFRRSRVLAVAALLVGAGFTATAFAHGALAFAASVAVWTLGEVMMAPLNSSVVADLAPESLRGRYQGAFGLTWSSGFLVAPLLGPQTIEHFGLDALWVACGVVGALTAVVHLVLGGPRAARLGKTSD